MKSMKKLLATVITSALLVTLCVPAVYSLAAENSVASESTEKFEYTQASSGESDVEVVVASTFSVKIPKKVILSGETKVGDYTVSVKGDIGGNEKITVAPTSGSIAMTQAGKADVTATVTQTKTEWGFAEVEPDNYNSTTGSISAGGATAGTWTGLVTFSIQLEENQ